MVEVTRFSQRAMQEVLGIPVYKQQDLASDPDPLFDVTGMISIELLIGVVEVVVATTTTLLLERTSATVAMCAATTITTDAVGTMYFFSGDAGAILSGTLAAGDAPVVGLAHLAGGPQARMIFGIPGVATETIRGQLDAAGTGKIGWYLWYRSLVVPGSPNVLSKAVAAA